MRIIEDKTKTMKRIEKIHDIEITELLRKMYVDEEKSLEEIGNFLDLSPATIHKWLKVADIRTRKMKWE